MKERMVLDQLDATVTTFNDIARLLLDTGPATPPEASTASLDPDVTGLGWSALATTATGDVVPLAELLDDADYAAEAERLDAHLGAGWRRAD